MTLAELFPAEDYRFHFRFERVHPGDFFRPTPEHEELVRQRRGWLEAAPMRHAALLPEGLPLLEEAIELALAWGTLTSEFPAVFRSPDPAWERCLALGARWEPDFLLLKAEPFGKLRLVAGVVCFPSSWSLEDKIGHPIEIIHEVVPGLNQALGPQIRAFLGKLRPGVAWLRGNWGLSRSAELNQHPARGLPRLDGTIRLEEVWLRVEHQALVALPRSDGVLFGIRIDLHPLSEIRAHVSIGPCLARALETMPEALASYKGLASARAALLRFLER